MTNYWITILYILIIVSSKHLPKEKIIPIIQGVDCLYHEATFMNDEQLRAKTTQHSTAAQAAIIAQKAGVGQLIIGHFSARYSNKNGLLNEAKAIFENTLLAEDMKVFEL
jgi:ribonuclease Z